MRNVSKIKPVQVNSKGQVYDSVTGSVITLTSEEMESLFRMHPEEMEYKMMIYRRNKKGVPSYELKRDNKFKNKLIWKFKNVGAKAVVMGSIVVSLGAAISNIEISNEASQTVVVTPEAITSGSNTYTQILEGVNIESFEEEEKVTAEQQFQQEMASLVKDYCTIYEVDYDVVYNKICELTDNFMDDKFLQEGCIEGVTCKGYNVYTQNRELSILIAVRAISQLPESFGLTDEQLYTGENYDSGISYEQLVAKYAEIFEIPEYRNLAYGIFRAETGGNSSLLVNHNNYGGLVSNTGKGFDHQSNRDKGAIEFIATLRYVYIDLGLTDAEMIQPKYAPGFENDAQQWINNVNWNANRADEIYGVSALNGNSNVLK